MKFNNLLFYSANTMLAHYINNVFYHGSHFVWCSPVYNAEILDKFNLLSQIPVSSNPYKIYHRYLEDVRSADMHSGSIKQNRRGIIRGAEYNYKQGKIEEEDLGRITTMVKKADFNKFMPIMYLIPSHIVEAKVNIVDVDKRANPLSTEYQIPNLKMGEFEIIQHH